MTAINLNILNNNLKHNKVIEDNYKVDKDLNKIIKKKFKLPIYNQFNITIILAEELTKEVVKLTKEESDINYNGIFFYKRNGTDVYIGFQKDKLSPGLVAHECLHATCYIMDYIGIKLTEESEEAYTYLVGYLVDTVYKLIDRYE